MRLFQLLSYAALGACAVNPLHKRSACPPKSSTSIALPSSTTATLPSTTTTSIPATGIPSCPSGSSNPDNSFALLSTNPDSNQGKYLCTAPQGTGLQAVYTVTYLTGLSSHNATDTSDVCYYTIGAAPYDIGTFGIDYIPDPDEGIGYGAYQGSPFFFQAFNIGERNSLRCSVRQGYLYCDSYSNVPYPILSQPGYISQKDGLQVVPYCV